jgi:hypothetical protein
MPSQFYVDAGYWDWGYCDYQPAGSGGGARRRNRVRLHGQEWDVTDAELDYILSRMVQEPEPIKPAPTRAKRRQQVRTVTMPAQYEVEPPPLARFNADNFILLRNEAERAQNAAILAALDRLLARREEDDEEVILVLM